MEEKIITKLAKASVTLLDLSPDSSKYGLSSPNEPDKLNIPKEWTKLIETIRFYYERDPIVSTVVDKFVDIGVNGLINNRGDSSDEVFDVYEEMKDDLLSFLKDMAREYLLSGLVMPEVTWSSIDLSKELGDNNIVTLPVGYWLRDPQLIIAKTTPIPNRLNYYMIITDETRYFIVTGGKYFDGTEDKETYEILVKQYPQFVAAVKKGDATIKLEDYFIVIRRAPVSGKAYPTPYLLGVLESLAYKRSLRKMDFAIASRVISAIQIITLGNDEFPLTEADEDQLIDLKEQMRWRGREDNIERVFQLFGNHTLSIEWIYPNTEAMLDGGKYDEVDQDIMFGLGFPRILLSGETDKSGTSSAEFAMFSPAESIRAVRLALKPFTEKLYKEIARLNGYDKIPELEFERLRLYDVEKMSRSVMDMYEKGVLSRTSYLNVAGYEFDREIDNIVREREILEENNIPEFAPQPFTPQPGNTGDQSPENETEDKTKESNLLSKLGLNRS